MLAADVLYEDEDVKPFMALIERIVAPAASCGWLNRDATRRRGS